MRAKSPAQKSSFFHRCFTMLALSLLLLTFQQPEAHAGACCMSATSLGIGRLLKWEKFAVGLRSSVLDSLGYWDSNGEWVPFQKGYSDVEWRSSVWGLYKLTNKATVSLNIPWSVNFRHSGKNDEVGGGIGDIQLGGQYEIITYGDNPYLSAWSVTFGLTGATGRATHDAQMTLGADVTSRGAWIASLGTSFEKVFSPLFVRLAFGAQVPFPMWRDDLEVYQRFGVLFQSDLSSGIELWEGFVLALSLRFSWEDDLIMDGQTKENTSRLDLGGSLNLSWRFLPHWTLQTGIDSGVFTHSFGDNKPGLVTLSLGIRYGYF